MRIAEAAAPRGDERSLLAISSQGNVRRAPVAFGRNQTFRS
jgi:hypothetical protein